MAVFLILGLLLCAKVQGTPVFVQTGEDFLLDLEETAAPKEGRELTWRVNETQSLARFSDASKTIYKSFLGPVDFFAQNYSLLLKNLRQSDSGNYSAHVSGDNITSVAEYKVTVLDPVSPVSLTVNSCSSDSSNLTVTCSTQDSLIRATFTCDKQTCSEERGDRAEFTTPAASLSVYLEDGAVICYLSNQVSRTEDIKKIEDFCTRHTVFAGISVCTLKVTVISSGLFIMLCTVIGVHIIVKLKKEKNN